jgi:hypothetical protein
MSGLRRKDWWGITLNHDRLYQVEYFWTPHNTLFSTCWNTTCLVTKLFCTTEQVTPSQARPHNMRISLQLVYACCWMDESGVTWQKRVSYSHVGEHARFLYICDFMGFCLTEFFIQLWLYVFNIFTIPKVREILITDIARYTSLRVIWCQFG